MVTWRGQVVTWRVSRRRCDIGTGMGIVPFFSRPVIEHVIADPAVAVSSRSGAACVIGSHLLIGRKGILISCWPSGPGPDC